MKKLKTLISENKPLSVTLLICAVAILGFYFYAEGGYILSEIKQGFMDGWNSVDCSN